MSAEYFQNDTLTPPRAFARVDRHPNTTNLTTAWRDSPPDAFSVRWTGVLVTFREGDYTLATRSDDGSRVDVDERRVVDNGGIHGNQLASGSVHLAAGVHALTIEYSQSGGAYGFDLLWARGNAPLETMPFWALRAGAARTLPRVLPGIMLDFVIALLQWCLVSIIVAAAAVGAWLAGLRVRDLLAWQTAWPATGGVVLASLLLNVVGVAWGAPVRWAVIELVPQFVVDAVAHRFAQGWFEWYPPAHFYVLALFESPLLLLDAFDRLSLSTPVGYALALVAGRLASVAAATGVVIAACLCATDAFGRRAGAFAAAIMAVNAPFVYYAKTANVDVPWLWWAALSLLYYIKILRQPTRTRDWACFGASAALAVCTKDQAYGLYALLPFAIVLQQRSEHRRLGRAHPLWLAIADSRLWAAAAASAIAFALCYNLVFNASGFISHFRLLTGPTVSDYRIVEPTFAGHLHLLQVTGRLVAISMGWPLVIASLCGLVVALSDARTRLTAVWLLLPAVTYYVGVIDLVLYAYDRFVLPLCFIASLFGGLAIDRFLTNDVRWSWRPVLVTAAFAYSVLYAATVDVLMLRDSRYAAERWMQASSPTHERVAMLGLPEYLPGLEEFSPANISSIAELQTTKPRFVVLNEDYERTIPHESPEGQLVAALEGDRLGYGLVWRYRRPSPWPWLPLPHPDLVGPRDETVVLSTLRDINPTIDVFEREPSASAVTP